MIDEIDINDDGNNNNNCNNGNNYNVNKNDKDCHDIINNSKIIVNKIDDVADRTTTTPTTTTTATATMTKKFGKFRRVFLLLAVHSDQQIMYNDEITREEAESRAKQSLSNLTIASIDFTNPRTVRYNGLCLRNAWRQLPFELFNRLKRTFVFRDKICNQRNFGSLVPAVSSVKYTTDGCYRRMPDHCRMLESYYRYDCNVPEILTVPLRENPYRTGLDGPIDGTVRYNEHYKRIAAFVRQELTRWAATNVDTRRNDDQDNIGDSNGSGGNVCSDNNKNNSGNGYRGNCNDHNVIDEDDNGNKEFDDPAAIVYHKLPTGIATWLPRDLSKFCPGVRFVRLDDDDDTVTARHVRTSPHCRYRVNHNASLCEICLIDEYGARLVNVFTV